MRYVPNSTVGSPPGMTNAGGSMASPASITNLPNSNPYGSQPTQTFTPYQQNGGFSSLNSGGAGTGLNAPVARQPNGEPESIPQFAREQLMPNPPSEEEKSRFIPDVFKQPFMQGLEAAAATGSYASQALPGAGNFQAGLYSPTLNPMEQQFMQASGYLGSLGLEQAFNEIGQEYALDPHNMAKNKAYYDAANQFAAQMMQTGSKLGLDRMSLATQQLPNVFNFPNQAAQYGQQSAAGYYNALEQARLGDTKFPYQWASTYPIQGSTYVQPPAPSGGK